VPLRDRWADDPPQAPAPYDPRDADQGAHEWTGSGASSGGAVMSPPTTGAAGQATATTQGVSTGTTPRSPSPTYNDPTAGGTQSRPITTQPAAYGDAGDAPQVPAYRPPAPTDGPADPWRQVNPEQPGTLRPTDLPADLQGARPWLPGQPRPAGGVQVAPEQLDTLVPRSAQTTPVSPAEQPRQPDRWQQPAEAAPYQDEYAPRQDVPMLPGESGRTVTQAIREAQRSPSQQINPLAVYTALGAVPFDVYRHVRQGLISDAEQGRMTGTDPLAPFRAMGVQFPDWLSPEAINPEGRPAGDVVPALIMAGALPDPADPLVEQGFRLAGRALGAVGRRVAAEGRTLGAVGRAGGDAIEQGGHRALDAIETGRQVAREANAADTGPLTMGTAGPIPSGGGEARIPRAGYAQDISPGAERMVRDASGADAPREVVRRADVGQKAQDILGASPDEVQRWQREAVAEAPDARAVRGEALRQAEYVDAENANRAIERLRSAQQQAREAGHPENMAAGDKFDAADALLEAAQAARAFGISATASTAEGRAAARALGQRRNAITARQAFASAERARAVGQDAAVAARDVQHVVRTGQITRAGEDRLRLLRDKLLEAERHGLTGDGASGRLAALEQPASTTAAAAVGPTGAARPGVPLGTRVATDVGNAALGSVVGATTGYAAPADTEEERRRHALTGATIGAVGFPVGGRLMRGRGGARALLGPVPTPEHPTRALAIGADPSKRYEMRYRVADLSELVPSNLPSGAPNPAFPRELQPRSRERAASQLQIDQIAQSLDPVALLHDAGRLDSGPPIVGRDNLVESGNGRTLAISRAAEQHPERYQAYVDTLRQNIGEFGLSESDLQGVHRPVLVRERVSAVDRSSFVAEANGSTTLRMSPAEQAAQSAANLSDDVVTQLQIGENDSIAAALRKTENRDLVRQWMGTLPENERAELLNAAGDISPKGYDALGEALLTRTYGEGATTRAFIEAGDSGVRNVQTAVMGSLPDMARAEALIRSGQRDAGLSVAGDVAKATEVLARLRQDGTAVGDYVKQVAMGERELTPFQEQVLQFLDQNQRRPAGIRSALREYADVVENAADPNQVDMFGGAVAGVTKEDAWASATSGVQRERQARVAARRAQSDAAYAARGPVAGTLPAGGPEGTLSIEGLPAVAGAADRPGAVMDMPRTGGPEGTLAQEGAPARLAAPTAAERGSLPTGGPEAQRDPLTGQMAPAHPEPGAADAPSGGSEGSLTLSSGRSVADVAAQIDDVLANPNAPGAAERLQALHQDLQEISTQGFTRSSEIRQRLQRTGLLRAGLASKEQNVDALVQALARVDPEKPEEMRAVLQIISKPRLIDRLLEYQYVNMLSSPVTHGVNTLSNVAQVAGRLFLQNPLEYVYSGGRSTGAIAAFQAAARGFKEGLGEAGQIMRTGTSSEQVNRATELGDYSHVSRELLTEKFGPVGALAHAISTRPLAAMDALLGNMAYASAAEQYAQRKADTLLKGGAESVKGMSREQARQHVMANIWDHPDIIERAGKIEDYTLLKGRGSSSVERNLRGLFSSRVPEGAGAVQQAGAFLANQIMPFTGVPINAAKQGAERTIGVPVTIARAARAYARGDGEQGAELASKATIGAAALGTATVLAMSGDITGEGPSDAGQRGIWELTHRRNSFRVPGTDAWISWEGSPMAIPFGMVAGAAQGIEEARERSARKGQTDAIDVAGSATLKGAQGAVQGFASQSFVRALGDQYQLITGDQTGLGAVASAAAGTASRFIPAGSMLNFLARVADGVERDVGKPQTASAIPENVGTRLASRLPGARQRLDPKLNAYGEPQQRIPPAPYYRGAGDMAGDAVTGAVDAAGVGAPSAPDDVAHPRREGVRIPLTMPEKRRFQEVWGQEWRRLLDANDAGRGDLPPSRIDDMRARARQKAVTTVLSEMEPDDVARRLDARRPAGVR
jgi:hypothetical protein